MTDVATLVADYLDVWTTATERRAGAGRGGGKRVGFYGIERLRALILDLAVRGRLVPQDARDEPGERLLKQIEVEKARQIKAGLVKQMPPTAPPKAWPFDLPASWSWTQLGAITDYGATDKANPGEVDDHTWVLELEDVEKGTSRLIERVRHATRKFQSQKNRFRAGDVVYGKLRPYLDKVLVADEEGVCTTEMVPMRGYVGVEADYLRLFMKTPFFIVLADSSTHGMNLPRLSTERARSIPFALPPLAEQRRIVAKVDALMALCDVLEGESAGALAAHQSLVEILLATLVASPNAALAANWARLESHFDTLFTTEASVDVLRATVLELAVRGKLVPQDLTDGLPSKSPRSASSFQTHRKTLVESRQDISAELQPFELPKNWRWQRFGDLIDPEFPIAYGVLVPGHNQADGVPFVRIADLAITNPSPKPEKAISPDIDAQYARTRLKGGELLMGVVGSIGKLGVAPASWAGANIARAICRIVPSELLSKAYVLWLLQSSFMQNSFIGDTRTLAQPTLNIGLIRLALTPVPPLAEQHRIVAKVDELTALCDALQARIAAAAATRKQLADAIVERAAA